MIQSKKLGNLSNIELYYICDNYPKSFVYGEF